MQGSQVIKIIINLESADATLGKATRRAKKPWISNEVLLLAEEKSKLRRDKGTKAKEERYKNLRSEIQRNIRKDKAYWLEERCREVNGVNIAGKAKEMYSAI